MRFHPDGKSLASGAQDTSVLLWDLTKIPNGKEKENPKEKEKDKDKDK
jgi:WD40 repeat protein